MSSSPSSIKLSSRLYSSSSTTRLDRFAYALIRSACLLTWHRIKSHSMYTEHGGATKQAVRRLQVSNNEQSGRHTPDALSWADELCLCESCTKCVSVCKLASAGQHVQRLPRPASASASAALRLPDCQQYPTSRYTVVAYFPAAVTHAAQGRTHLSCAGRPHALHLRLNQLQHSCNADPASLHHLPCH